MGNVGFGGFPVNKSTVAGSRHGCIPYSMSISDRATELGQAVFEEGQRLRMFWVVLVQGRIRTSLDCRSLVPEPRATYNKLRQEIFWPI